MNKSVRLIAFILILAVFAGCSQDAIVENPNPTVPEGYIRAALDLKVEEPDSIQTRATDDEEKAFDDTNVWVLMFDNSSPMKLVQAPVKAIKSGTKLYVLLRATTQPVNIYTVAGLSSTLNTAMGTATYLPEGMTFANVISKLQTDGDVPPAGVPIGSGAYFHMSSAGTFLSTGTIPLTSIQQQDLTRNVAKINVDASALNIADFKLEGVILANGAKKGFVFPQTTLPVNHGGTIQYDEKTNNIVGNKLTSEIYLYENAGFSGALPNPTKLIIKGSYKGGPSGYYRMDILKNNGDGTYTPYDIKRNCCYTLKIKKIENGGYLSITDALAQEPSNTWYDVVVKDQDSYDIVSNGHYYMGVSNSEFIVYGNGTQLANLPITTVTTNAPAGTRTSITPPTITGLSAVTSSLTATNGTVTKTNIYATLTAANATEYIDIRVGNLTRRINIRRSAAVNADGHKTDFIDPQYVAGEVISNMPWVRLAATSTADFVSSPTTLILPSGGIYVHFKPALNLTPAIPAEVYVSKANNQGRAKMLLFKQ